MKGAMDHLPEIEQRLFRMSVRHSVFIILGLHPSNTGRRAPWENVATGSLISFKGRPCVVTDAHILRIFQEHWERDPRTIFQVGGARLFFLDVQRRMLSISDGSDLAVLDVTSIESDVTEGEGEVGPPTFYVSHNWPPADVCEGDVLFFGGYRDCARETTNHVRHTLLAYCNLAAVVTDAFPDRFKCKFNRDGWVDAFNPGDDSGVLDDNFSGLSGAPIFRLWTRAQREEYRDREFPLMMFPTDERPADLVGFVMEHWPKQDMLVASASGNVKRDGTLWGNTKR
jgi:hypothetical protein